MHRRTFLQSVAAVSLGCGVRLQADPTSWTAQGATSAPRGRVVILGGGLAGLSAGYELQRNGFEVTILEARTRPGGRVYTLREPFSDGLYAEVGAARIQDSHAFTLRYVKQFNLTLDPFFPTPTSGSSVAFVAGQRLVGPQGRPIDLSRLPLPFTPEERKLGMGASFGRYLFAHVKEVGDPSSDNWPASDLSRFEVPIADFCLKQGASPALLRLFALGHDLGGMSALHMLRDTAVAASTKAWFKIRGGNDQLPKAFAALLAERIHYGAAVARIEQSDTGVRVTYLRDRTPVHVDADYAVCTIPPPVLRRVETSPSWSSAKRIAIDEVDLMPMARVFLQSRRRFWLERGDTGWASSDDPIDVWDYTRDQPGTRGILGAYTSGRMAQQITVRDPAERGAFVLEMMERLHPGMREHYEGSASYSWVTDPWALGAAAEYRSGQLSAHFAVLRAPEGRIHFAGEHTSAWGGWMNGGLESGNRAAAELQRRA